MGCHCTRVQIGQAVEYADQTPFCQGVRAGEIRTLIPSLECWKPARVEPIRSELPSTLPYEAGTPVFRAEVEAKAPRDYTWLLLLVAVLGGMAISQRR
jgi:hypothetical protein